RHTDFSRDWSSDVCSSDLKSFHLIVDYLCRSGSEPCYFSMPMVNNNAVKRQEAYRLAMEKLGYEPRIIDLEESRSWDFERYAFRSEERRVGKAGKRSVVKE